jgi:hypothetical protein
MTVKKTYIILAACIATAGLASASVTYTVTGVYTAGSGTSGADMTITGGTNTFTLDWVDSTPTATISASFSNINYGLFDLSCVGTCDGSAVTVPAFTFQITVSDATDGAVGKFTGTYAGGQTVQFNSVANTGASSVDVFWSPGQLGPNALNATSGNFNQTQFTISSPTFIVDPTTNSGQSTIQGTFTEFSSAPEPATLAMVGGALLGLGLLRKKFQR